MTPPERLDATQLLHSRTSIRARRLQQLRKERALLKDLIDKGQDVGNLPQILRRSARVSRMRSLERNDLRTLSAEMKSNFHYACQKHDSIIGDDGYSYCGLEDARLDEQDQAREEAQILRRAIMLIRTGVINAPQIADIQVSESGRCSVSCEESA